MKPADNFCVKTHLSLQAALPVNHSNNTGTAHFDSAHGCAEWKWDLCCSQQPISRPVWFFEVDCISIISGEESFNVHGSCSWWVILVQVWKQTGPKQSYAYPPEVIFCFLPYQWLWCAKMNRHGPLSGLIRAAWRSEGSHSPKFSLWQRPACFSIFKSKAFLNSEKMLIKIQDAQIWHEEFSLPVVSFAFGLVPREQARIMNNQSVVCVCSPQLNHHLQWDSLL